MGNRRKRTAKFTVKVVSAAAWEEGTVTELSSLRRVHAGHINAWRKALIDGVVSLFASSDASAGAAGSADDR